MENVSQQNGLYAKKALKNNNAAKKGQPNKAAH